MIVQHCVLLYVGFHTQHAQQAGAPFSGEIIILIMTPFYNHCRISLTFKSSSNQGATNQECLPEAFLTLVSPAIRHLPTFAASLSDPRN